MGGILASLHGAIAPRARNEAKIPNNGELVTDHRHGDRRLIVSGLHERVNLISFSWAEVFVGHKQLRLPGQEALNAKHLQAPNHYLFKVTLRVLIRPV
jgi:hypothetical protein